jgi:hypothetical protein
VLGLAEKSETESIPTWSVLGNLEEESVESDVPPSSIPSLPTSDYPTIDEDEDGSFSEDEELTPYFAAMREEFRDAMENLKATPVTDNDERCEQLQKLLMVIFDNVRRRHNPDCPVMSCRRRSSMQIRRN